MYHLLAFADGSAAAKAAKSEVGRLVDLKRPIRFNMRKKEEKSTISSCHGLVHGLVAWTIFGFELPARTIVAAGPMELGTTFIHFDFNKSPEWSS